MHLLSRFAEEFVGHTRVLYVVFTHSHFFVIITHKPKWCPPIATVLRSTTSGPATSLGNTSLGRKAFLHSRSAFKGNLVAAARVSSHKLV